MIIFTFFFAINLISCLNRISTISCPTSRCICSQSSRSNGLRCESCRDGFFNVTSNCRNRCNCDPYGSRELTCERETGQCPCRPNTTSRRCNSCASTYFNLTYFGCVGKCECDTRGSNGNCDIKTSECECFEGYTHRKCDKCEEGFYEMSLERTCTKCNCNTNGTVNNSISCESLSGQCKCKENVLGLRCDTCAQGYYGLDKNGCKKCNCEVDGTVPGTVCDSNTGQCVCKPLKEGLNCDRCVFGFFLVVLDTAECIRCECDAVGSIPGTTCDTLTGECVCKVYDGVGGTRCDECLPGFYEFSSVFGQCKTCECNEAGSVESVCDLDGKCSCKELVSGFKCDTCVNGTSGLSASNPQGCSKRPFRQPVPSVRQISQSVISIAWNPPIIQNAGVSFYLLYRNNQVLFNSTLARSFNDTNIHASSIYTYSIEAFNEFGSARSRSITILTRN